MCVVLYIVFSYALLSFVQITSFYLMRVNQHSEPVLYLCLICVSLNY